MNNDNMNNKNNQNNNDKKNNRQTGIFGTSLFKRRDELVVDTTMNIKKATAKKALKKSALVSAVAIKKTFQWICNIFLTFLLIGTITGIIVGGAFALYVKNYLIEPDFDITGLEQNLDMTTKIFYIDENGKQVELVDERIYGSENRSWVSYSSMPDHLINSFLAIEDERYWQHNGVDWRRTFGAAIQFVTGNDDYGGSTITQQLIKNVTQDDDTTIQRKVKEIFRALSLSEKRTKEEVLEMYLNRIHLSRSNYGVQAAANYYFGKDVSELTLLESACLASIPKSPTKYDPVRNPEYNKQRREVVLDKLLELKWITKEEYDEAMSQELVLNITLEEASAEAVKPYSYYKDALIEQIVKDLGTEYGHSRQYALDLIYSGGLEITVTMDPEIQGILEDVFEDMSSFQMVDDGIQPQSAMVIMDPYTGDVLGLVGGRGEKTGKLELNRATASTRQVGSSIKPLTVYAPAMDLGIINYSTVLDDSPVYMEKMHKYWPGNAPSTYQGLITANEAVMRSKNTIAVKLVKDELTPEYSYNFAKNKLHISSLVESDKDVAPMALGGLTNGISVLEMTAAYTIFPSGGSYAEPRLYTRVLNPDGTVLLKKTINQEPVISEATATVMTKMLQNVVSSGTASRITLDQKVNCAGKTGTTNDNKDLYYCGFTPYYVGACWFGYDIPKSLYKFNSNPAMLVWDKVMDRVHQRHFEASKNGTEKLRTFDFSKLKAVTVCRDSGLLPSEACGNDLRGARTITAYFYEEEGVPTRTCDVHVNVDWCTETNMMANDYCPDSCRKTVSLVREEERSFMHGNVPIEDAIYTYRDVEINSFDEIPDSSPFYRALLEPDEHIGYSKTYKAGDAINRMCRLHYKTTEEQEKEHQNNYDGIPDDLFGFEVNDFYYDDTLDSNGDEQD